MATRIPVARCGGKSAQSSTIVTAASCPWILGHSADGSSIVPDVAEDLHRCVRDLDATMRTYVDEYGIGPWQIYEFNLDTVTEMVKDGQQGDSACRIAVTMVGSVQWELIEPLDDRSIYAEFLATKGEGLHHVAVGTPNYGEALHTLQAQWRRVLRGGVYNSVTFAYMSTDEDLGVITEIFDWPRGLVQEPDAVYPGR